MTLILGDCVEKLRELEDGSADAVVTDPPYGLGFMGKDWDSPGGARSYQEWCETWAREALRVLKPGGHLLAFGGTRTYHRLACGVEDAGFEIRDELAWLYGSGFPKSLDVSKAIDKAAGAEREIVGERRLPDGRPVRDVRGVGNHEGWDRPWKNDDALREANLVVTAPATADAERWQGWGTALKPAHEPICVARKSLVGTVAANVAEHGTGALNIDACRIGFESEADQASAFPGGKVTSHGAGSLAGPGAAQEVERAEFAAERNGLGRWPANVVLDEEAAEMLDEQSGERAAGNHPARRGGRESEKVYGSGWSSGTSGERRGTERGGASRFFYCAKTSRAERNAGLDGFGKKQLRWSSGDQNPGSFQGDGTDKTSQNHHPTVKPIALMRWLVRLVTPPGGTILDPFLGSGTTGIAAALEGFEFVGIEREPDYLAIAEARIAHWASQPQQLGLLAEGA